MFRILFLFIVLSGIPLVNAQDTLRLSIQKADSLFLANNYYLLAASMNIQAQKAQIIQAKVYPNPIFTAELNAYDPANAKAFHVGKSGQKVFQLEQLILLGGKRKTEIELAKTNAQIAELEFQKLVRELKFKLHSNLYTIGQQQFLISKYSKQLVFLDTLLVSYEMQVKKGNIPLKEYVRLKGAYIELNNDRAELYADFTQTQTELQILLQLNQVVLPDSDNSDLTHYFNAISLNDIQSLAQENLPDLQIMQTNKTLAEQYLKYQKSVAVPDINVYASYDQRGGAFDNQVNAGISIPLPVWNRNRGAIKMAEFQINQASYNLKAKENEIYSLITNHYALYKQTLQEYNRAMQLYNDDFEMTIDGMNTNFQKRNISMVEFIDFFESYNNVLAELFRIKTQLVLSAEQLNLLIGKDIY